MEKIEKERVYLEERIEEFKKRIGSDVIADRLIASYFDISFYHHGIDKARILVNLCGDLSIQVSDDYGRDKQTSYYLYLIPIALLYQKDHPIMPDACTVIFDLKKDNGMFSIEQKELYKEMGLKIRAIAKQKKEDVGIVR